MVLKVPECLPKDSWFRDWVDLWPVAESPKSFILFSGMAILGACLGRKVWIDQDVHIVRPMLNLLLIGPSGIGKSSAVKIARKLLPFVPEWNRPQFIEGGATKEKLHRDLAIQPKAIIFCPELAAFFSKEKYKENLIPYVTNLLDYEDVVELRTVKDDVIRIENPEVSILGGSTVEWLQEQLPNAAVSGGFLARFLILNEEHKGQKIANPHRFLSDRQRKELVTKREEAFSAFPYLLDIHNGAMDYADYDAAETYAKWYNSHEPEVGYLAPFAARAGELVLRLAMILAISCRRSEMTDEDVRSAIMMYEYIASRLGSIIIPTSPQGKLSALILSTVGRTGLTEEEITYALKSQASQWDIDKTIDSLVFSGSITVRGDKFLIP